MAKASKKRKHTLLTIEVEDRERVEGKVALSISIQVPGYPEDAKPRTYRFTFLDPKNEGEAEAERLIVDYFRLATLRAIKTEEIALLTQQLTPKERREIAKRTAKLMASSVSSMFDAHRGRPKGSLKVDKEAVITMVEDLLDSGTSPAEVTVQKLAEDGKGIGQRISQRTLKRNYESGLDEIKAEAVRRRTGKAGQKSD